MTSARQVLTFQQSGNSDGKPTLFVPAGVQKTRFLMLFVFGEVKGEAPAKSKKAIIDRPITLATYAKYIEKPGLLL